MRKYFFIFFTVLFIDQISKWLVNTHLPQMSWYSLIYPYGGIAVFKDFFGIQFSLVHEINQGAAWGMFSKYPQILIVLRVILILALLAYLIFGKKDKNIKAPLTLILAGAIGNVLDVIWYGHVIDMFYFKFGSYSYPIFNVADSAIFVGALWLIFQSLFQKK